MEAGVLALTPMGIEDTVASVNVTGLDSPSIDLNAGQCWWRFGDGFRLRERPMLPRFSSRVSNLLQLAADEGAQKTDLFG